MMICDKCGAKSSAEADALKAISNNVVTETWGRKPVCAYHLCDDCLPGFYDALKKTAAEYVGAKPSD